MATSVTEDMIISSYYIKTVKEIVCDICNKKLHNKKAKKHMKRHYHDLILLLEETYDQSDETPTPPPVCQTSQQTPIIHAPDCSVAQCSSNEAGVEESDIEILSTQCDQQTLHTLPPEIMSMICKELNLCDIFNLDIALGGNIVTNTGIKLDLKIEKEKCIREMKKNMEQVYNRINNFQTVLVPFANIVLRRPELYIIRDENRIYEYDVRSSTSFGILNFFYEFKCLYLDLLRSLYINEETLQLIDDWTFTNTICFKDGYFYSCLNSESS